jgi:hypothetical protein
MPETGLANSVFRYYFTGKNTPPGETGNEMTRIDAHRRIMTGTNQTRVREIDFVARRQRPARGEAVIEELNSKSGSHVA